MSTLTTIDLSQLAQVSGGAIRAAGGSTTDQTAMIQQLTTTVAGLQNQKPKHDGMMPMMLAAMMMNQNRMA